MLSSKFIHLRAHSSYSLLEGAIQIPQLIKQCHAFKMPAIALTDSGNMFGALEFSMEATKKGVQPIMGGIFQLDPSEEFRNLNGNGSGLDEILLIAKNKTGYSNLLKLSSSYFLDNEKGKEHLTLDKLESLSEGLIVLTCGIKGTLGRLILNNRPNDAARFLQRLNSIFADHLYIELMRHGLKEEALIEPSLIDFGLKHHLPFVATNEIYFLNKSMHKAHDVLLCIADGKYLHEEDRRRVTDNHYFKSGAEMQELFEDIPEAIENTIEIARRCSVKAEERKIAFPHYQTIRSNSYDEELRILSEEGLRQKLAEYSNDHTIKEKVYWDRLNYELAMIIKMHFASYILIVADFVRWAKENGIPVGPGRGSGAGCIVNWVLGITDPDPIKFGLLFERFLNPERVSLPDVDIDFCQDRRSEVVKYVRNKYGENKVAHIITFGKLQARAVVRDVGRVLQLPYSMVDRIAKLVPFNAVNPVTLSQAIEIEPELKRLREQNEAVNELLDLSLKLEGLYRHVSIHAGGVVIADQDLGNLVPLYKDDKSDMLVIQYSMKYAEAAGLIKFDFLGVKTLTMLNNCEKLIQKANSDFCMKGIKFNDELTFKMLGDGLSVGVFQLESERMQGALRKMKPDSIEDLIALGALNRPGPMNSIATYIDCKHGKAHPENLHPKLEKILQRTFGVLIYQEQVIETAQVLAGYTAAAADLLRRAMGKKIKAEMDAQKEIFIKGATKRGIRSDQAAHIFNLIEKFAGYGFNRSHAVAYGIISYYTAYLKAHYTPEFLVSIMNIERNDTDKLHMFIEEAKCFKIPIIGPDVNLSMAEFSVKIDDNEKTIVYGLGAIRNMSIAAMEDLVAERDRNGPYKDIFDFAMRANDKCMSKRQLEYLIKSGALDSLCNNRKQLFDSIEVLIKYNMLCNSEENPLQLTLFSKTDLLSPPALTQTTDWDVATKLNYECESFGFYLLKHPLDFYKSYLDSMKLYDGSYIKNKLGIGTFSIKLAAIPISVDTKSSPKGRYVICIMSTQKGMLKTFIFDEEVLKTGRDLIYSKAPVVIDADIIKDETSDRVIVRNLVSLDAYLSASSPVITITVQNDDQDVLNQVKAALHTTETSNFNARIILNVVHDGRKVKIELPKGTTCDLSKLVCNEALKDLISIEKAYS